MEIYEKKQVGGSSGAELEAAHVPKKRKPLPGSMSVPKKRRR